MVVSKSSISIYSFAMLDVLLVYYLPSVMKNKLDSQRWNKHAHTTFMKY